MPRYAHNLCTQGCPAATVFKHRLKLWPNVEPWWTSDLVHSYSNWRLVILSATQTKHLYSSRLPWELKSCHAKTLKSVASYVWIFHWSVSTLVCCYGDCTLPPPYSFIPINHQLTRSLMLTHTCWYINSAFVILPWICMHQYVWECGGMSAHMCRSVHRSACGCVWGYAGVCAKIDRRMTGSNHSC